MTLIHRTNPVFDSLSEFINEYVVEDKPVFNSRAKVPAVNIKENEKDFVIELAVPGIKKEDIDIELEKDILTVSSNLEKEKIAYSKHEFDYSRFNRSFSLPKTIDIQKIQAKYVDGILSLTIAKTEKVVKPKRNITIK
ncbi:MAG: Hsp20/alpha crystallin family protein [Bacteroidota bacterium]|nr:Hsp20/alpha crystallin family protein [Bacteroidota bacterium]